MYAKSLWVNRENIAKNVNLTIGFRNIYVNKECISKDSNIVIFTHLKELKEIEYVDVVYAEVNKITIRTCRCIEIKDGFISFMDKSYNSVAYMQMCDVQELTIRTIDGIMYIVDQTINEWRAIL